MDLKQLEYIVAIAEERSFSKAAKRLYISQSALSQCLSRLEASDHLPPLFRREKGGLLLTDAGRIYVNGARTILNLSAEADRAAKMRFGTIRVSVAPVAEYLFLTEVLTRFKRLHPDVSLAFRCCHSDTAKQQIMEGQLDLAVIIDQIPDYSLFCSHPIYQDRVVWIASEEAGGNPESLPVILPPAGTFWRGTCDDIYHQEGIQGEVFCETTDLNIIDELVRKLPATSFILESAFEGGNGIRKLPLRRDYPYYISAVTSHTLPLSGRMEELIVIMQEFMNPFSFKKSRKHPVYRRPEVHSSGKQPDS